MKVFLTKNFSAALSEGTRMFSRAGGVGRRRLVLSKLAGAVARLWEPSSNVGRASRGCDGMAVAQN